MIRYIVAAFLALLLLFPAYAMAEDFECTGCYSGTITMFHGSKELSPVMTLIGNGIYISNSENKVLDNVTFHCEAVRRVSGQKMETNGYCKLLDPDGGIIIVEISGEERKFLEVRVNIKASQAALGPSHSHVAKRSCQAPSKAEIKVRERLNCAEIDTESPRPTPPDVRANLRLKQRRGHWAKPIT